MTAAAGAAAPAPPGYTCAADGACNPGTGGETCAALVDCAIACGNDWNCTMSCYNKGTPEAQNAFMVLLSCASSQCGLPPDSACLYMSFMGACYSQYSACVAN